MTTTDVGWTICPICGAIIGDAWAHAFWHETALADLIAEAVTADAIDLHVKNIARLKECIARAKANGETTEIVKN